MERNPLASLMMGLRGGGGSTEGARAYPGGYQVDWNAIDKHYKFAGGGQQPPGLEKVDWELEKAIEDLLNQLPAAKGMPDAQWQELLAANSANVADTAGSWKSSAMEQLQPGWHLGKMPAYAEPPPSNVPEYLPGQPTVRAYHGTSEGPVGTPIHPYEANLREEFQRETGQELRSTVADPGAKFRTPEPHRTEQGVFFTPDPKTASKYASRYPGAKVFPVDLDMKNSVTVDLRKIPGMTDYQRIYDPQYVRTAIEQAKQNNKDFVVIKGMNDVGGEADQIIAVKPAGKVKNAITGETMYAHPLSALLAAALAGGTVSRRQRADETTIAPENISGH